MLTALIVDDEKLVRMTLVHKIPWADNNVEIVGEAANGQEAYQLCLEKRPDILITDIAMPVMDGIELTQKINVELPETQVIFFSGIDDFNYVKTAMEINVKGYILKPIRVQELLSTVRRVSYNITLNKQRKEKEIQLKKTMHENFELMKRLFLYELVSGGQKSPASIAQKLAYFGMDSLAKGSNCVALVRLEPSQIAATGKEDDLQFYVYSAASLAEEFLQSAGAGTAFSYSEDQVVVLFNASTSLHHAYSELCMELAANIQQVLGLDVKIGIGRWAESCLFLSHSLADAQDALRYSAFYQLGSVIEIGDIAEKNQNTAWEELNDLANSQAQELGAAIKVGDSERAAAIVHSFFDLLAGVPSLPESSAKDGCLRFISELGRCMSEVNRSIDEFCENKAGVFSTVMLSHDVKDLRDYLLTLAKNTSLYFNDMHRRKNSEVVAQITKIIESEYCNDISITYLSEKVFLTPNYISLIFKKETGRTITDFITNLRVEKAKELLSGTSLKVYEIAEQVGYTNQYYFSSVFKKKTGFQPKHFQKPTTETDS